MIIISGTIDDFQKLGIKPKKILANKIAGLTQGELCSTKENDLSQTKIIRLDLPLPTLSIKTSANTCYCCKSTDFWQSAVTAKHFVCRKCHPPAPNAEKKPT